MCTLPFTSYCHVCFSSLWMTSTFVTNPDQLCYKMSPNLWVFTYVLTISCRLKVLDTYCYKGICFPFHLLPGHLMPLGPITGGIKWVSWLRYGLPGLPFSLPLGETSPSPVNFHPGVVLSINGSRQNQILQGWLQRGDV